MGPCLSMHAHQHTPAPLRHVQPLHAAQLDAVMAIEQQAYPVPWTRGNFSDSLTAGYTCWQLLDAAQHLLGYLVAMEGVQEMHLLNLTVAPAAQGQGHARHLLDALVALCRERHAQALWLEVRESNARARALYARYGFTHIGVRRGYYPQPPGSAGRENAVVMNLNLTPPEPPHVLD